MDGFTKLIRNGGIGGIPQLRKLISYITLSLLLAIYTVTFSQLAQANMATDWNENATIAAAAPVKNGIRQTRIYAMVQAAVHDALNAIDRRYQPYALDERMDPHASPEAAVATAAYSVLVHELPDSQHASLNTKYTNSLSGIPDG